MAGGEEQRLIRPASDADADTLWTILQPVIRAGETLAHLRDMTREDALALWLGPDRRTYVLNENGVVAGAFYIRANQAGGGAHVANAGYVTAAHAVGRGVARAMCAASLDIARDLGFRAMQFNFVISTNAAAVHLWQQMGFVIVGALPGAFAHPAWGDVDALVMYRSL